MTWMRLDVRPLAAIPEQIVETLSSGDLIRLDLIRRRILAQQVHHSLDGMERESI